MEISWLGYGCVRVRARTAAVVMDPYQRGDGLDMGRPTADIVTISHDDARHGHVAGVRGEPLVITGPGEYEVQGVQLAGIRTSLHGAETGSQDRSVAYVIEAEGLRVIHMGCIGSPPTDEEAEALANADVLLLTIGPDGLRADDAARTFRSLEPAIVIPIGYSAQGTEDPDLRAFLTAAGLTPEAPVQRFSIQARSTTETQKVILLDCRG